MIKQNHKKYGLSKDFVEGITVDAIEEEIKSCIFETKKTSSFVDKLFDKVIRDLINAGMVQNKDGNLYTIEDYEKLEDDDNIEENSQ